MSKFSTTNPSLFTKQNKENIPDWMSNLTDNLQIKQRETIELEAEQKGVFAERQQVYRPEMSADPRYLKNNYNETKLISESKISLAKFLVGKYYKVTSTNVGTDYVALDAVLDSVGANFQFPFEIKAGKLTTANIFYANNGEYPFSKAGLEESLADIKAGRTKESKKVEAVGKAYLINREEIVRRYNGSLRQATDKINELLHDGVIIGAGSNTYASFYDADQLFPQLEKQGANDKMGEFHFTPNQEHVASNQVKSARLLTIDANNYLVGEFGKDVSVKEAQRNGNELLVSAVILGKNGVRENINFSFGIEGEKLSGIKTAQINQKHLTTNELHQQLTQIDNSLLNKYLSTGKTASKHAYSGMVLTSKDIESKLFKTVEASQIPNVIKNWIADGLVTPINSSTFATEKTFEELLRSANVDMLTDEQTSEISDLQKHFGGGLEVETDLIKPQEEVREVEDKGTDEQRLFNANSFINKHLKKYRVSSFNKINRDSYAMNVSLMNKATGTRHDVPFTISFDGSKVVECVASIGDHDVSIKNLAQAFIKNKVLAKYLQDKTAGLTVESIVISRKNLQRKLASVVTASKIDETIQKWLDNGLMTELNQETLASDHSFEELLSKVADDSIITDEEQKVADYQSQHFGRQLKVNTDETTEDTGVRDVIESEWSIDKKNVFASDAIGRMFKEYIVVAAGESETTYSVVADVRNPLSGTNLKLAFNFNKEEGKLKNLVSVAHGNEEVPVNKLSELLAKNVSEAQKQFTAHNKVDNRSNDRNLISKSNLMGKLKVVASTDKIASIIDGFVSKGFIQPLNSATFASQRTVAELVALAGDQMNVKEGKEQIQLANRDEHRFNLGSAYEMRSETRALEVQKGLAPKLIEAKNSIESTINKAESMKKITANKSSLLKVALENAESAKDLEMVAKELRRYFQ
ncbi:MAG: hypothetical protein K0R18_462 [Bacillales bacterium]|jgi:hypothetical protein|nr:hypothetical protein [Bacillales bacterium]